MLADQVRCSSGYTEVRGGVIRLIGAEKRTAISTPPPEPANDAKAPPRAQRSRARDVIRARWTSSARCSPGIGC